MTLLRPDVIRFAGNITAIVRVDSVSALMTCRQFAVLFAVNEARGSATVRGLAADLNLTKPVITRAVDSLVGLGLTHRRRCKTDRRDVFISITPKAITFFAELAALFNTEE